MFYAVFFVSLIAITLTRGIARIYIPMLLLSTVGIQVLFHDDEIDLVLFLVIVVLYFLPLLFFSVLLRRGVSNSGAFNKAKFSDAIPTFQKKIYIFFYSIIVYFGIYVFFKYDVIYLRVGYSELENIYENMLLPERIVTKVFEDISPVLLVFSLMFMRSIDNQVSKVILLATVALNVAFLALNSRYDFIALTMVLAYITYGFEFDLKAIFKIFSYCMAIIALVLIRPIYELFYWGRDDAFAVFLRVGQWIDRLNGYASLNVVYEGYERVGLMLGAAWYQLYSPLCGFLDICDRLVVNEPTGSKYLVWAYYTGKNIDDYVSSFLSDWIANFGFYSLPLFALITAYILKYVSSCRYSDAYSYAVKIYLMYKVFHVNANFGILLKSMFVELPVIILFVIFLKVALKSKAKYIVNRGV